LSGKAEKKNPRQRSCSRVLMTTKETPGGRTKSWSPGRRSFLYFCKLHVIIKKNTAKFKETQ